MGAKLYLPKEWTSDKKRCKKAGIPPEERKYRTKPELGLEIIEDLERVIEYDWVGGDSVYGNSPQLRKRLREMGKAFVVDVGEELQVCQDLPRPLVPQRSGKGTKPTRYVIAEKKVRAEEFAWRNSSG